MQILEEIDFREGEFVLSVRVEPQSETVWLNRQQMAQLFERDVKTIGKHIQAALREELEDSTVAKFATVQTEGSREVVRQVEYYNLDMIISVGYRVKSARGVQFRRWATIVLRQYLMQGYVCQQQRLQDLSTTIRVMKRVENKLDAAQILAVVQQYTRSVGSAYSNSLRMSYRLSDTRPLGTVLTPLCSFSLASRLMTAASRDPQARSLIHTPQRQCGLTLDSENIYKEA